MSYYITKEVFYGKIYYKYKILAIIILLTISKFVFANEIKIGVLLPLTGSQAFYGKEAKMELI